MESKEELEKRIQSLEKQALWQRRLNLVNALSFGYVYYRLSQFQSQLHSIQEIFQECFLEILMELMELM